MFTIRYFDAEGRLLAEQDTGEPYSEAARARWEAWLNDDTIDHGITFLTFDTVHYA